LGTSRGLFAYRERWSAVPVPPAVSGEPVFAIASSGNRTVAGTAGGVVLLGAGEPKLLTAADGLPSSRVTAVAVGDGIVAAGTANGLALIRGWVAE
jgi:hypothetical protein